MVPETAGCGRDIDEGRSNAIPGTLSNAIVDAESPYAVKIAELPLGPALISRNTQDAQVKAVEQGRIVTVDVTRGGRTAAPPFRSAEGWGKQ